MPLCNERYIDYERRTNYIIFGRCARVWQDKIKDYIQKEDINTPTPQTTYNINAYQGANVHAGQGDMHVTITNRDAEKLVELLKDLLENNNSSKEKFSGLKNMLESGRSAVDIVKALVGLC